MATVVSTGKKLISRINNPVLANTKADLERKKLDNDINTELIIEGSSTNRYDSGF